MCFAIHIKKLLNECLDKVRKREIVKSLKKNWAGILKAMQTNITNAVSEGINSTIQLSKFRARGFRNIDNFINCIYLMSADYKISIPQIMAKSQEF